MLIDPSVSVSIVVGGIVVGSGTINYTDQSASGSSQNIVSETVSFSIIVGGITVGSGSITYDDYITYNGGGSRTVDIPVSVVVGNITVGNGTIEITDTYGAVSTLTPLLQILSITPNPVNATYGVPFTVSVVVKEVNGVPCNGEIRILDENNNIVASTVVSFNGGDQKQVDFNITQTIPVGTHNWSVVAYNSTTRNIDDTEQLTVNVSTPGQNPVFTIKNIIPSTVNTTPGSRFRVTFVIGITSATSGTCILRIYDHMNNKIVEQWINFPNTADQTITVDMTAPDTPGTYTWKAQAYSFNTGTMTDEKTFIINVASTGGGGGGGATTATTGIPWWVIIIAIILLLLLLRE